MHRVLANGCAVTGGTAAKTGCFIQAAISAAATGMRGYRDGCERLPRNKDTSQLRFRACTSIWTWRVICVHVDRCT